VRANTGDLAAPASAGQRLGRVPAGVLDSPALHHGRHARDAYLKGIESFDDLDAVGGGTQRVNFFGHRGHAVIRGIVAGPYYDGMQRAYQRNEMPTPRLA
jgi:hypothetical protein